MKMSLARKLWRTSAGKLTLLAITAVLIGVIIFGTVALVSNMEQSSNKQSTTKNAQNGNDSQSNSDSSTSSDNAGTDKNNSSNSTSKSSKSGTNSKSSTTNGGNAQTTGSGGGLGTATSPAPSPTPSPTPSPPPSPPGFQANCIVTPSTCGYPDATNTGVPAGTSLSNSGSVTVTTNGATIQNLSIHDGQIIVRANNVTIKNVRISGCTYYPIDYDDGAYSGLVVQDSEIASDCDATTAGMSFGNYTAIRMNIHGTADGFKANSNATIRDSYIHNLFVTQNSHNDGVQSTGGSNVTLRHNTFDLGSAGVCVQFGSSDSGWLVTENLFNCAGWMLNGNSGTTSSTFTNNRFTRLNGSYGPASLPGGGITWSGNYYDNNNGVANL